MDRSIQRPIADEPGTLRVLIVTRDPDDASQYETALVSAGGFVPVGRVFDGTSAVRCATIAQPDVVLLDAELPLMSGVMATQLICRRVPGVVVLVLTSSDTATASRVARRMGAHGCITANREPADVARAVRAAVPRLWR